MAGDWIKVEKTTIRKPEVLRLAADLGIHPDHAFGLCFRFWNWCDDNLQNGNAVGVTEMMLDALLERDGIAKALINVGWLRVRNGSLEVPNYDRHLSENAKKRGLSQQRTAKSRSRNCNDESVTEALPEKRREEKRREEVKTVAGDVSDSWEIPKHLDTPKVREELEAFARMRSKIRKPIKDYRNTSRVFKKFSSVDDLLFVLDLCIANEWQGIDTKYLERRKPVSGQSGFLTPARQREENMRQTRQRILEMEHATGGQFPLIGERK